MNANAPVPTDRAAFDRAIAEVRVDHLTLRHLAELVSKEPSADTALSLIDAMLDHEGAEAQLFPLPFLTRPPEAVLASGARARQACTDYREANFRLPTRGAAAAAQVADLLLEHLAAEDAWLDWEADQRHRRVLNSI